jgi:hypothetical protein
VRSETAGAVVLEAVFLTVTVQDADFPDFALTVILEVPAAFALTIPVEATLATEVLLLFHVTFFAELESPFEGASLYLKVLLCPACIVTLEDAGETRVMLVTPLDVANAGIAVNGVIVTTIDRESAADASSFIDCRFIINPLFHSVRTLCLLCEYL